MARAEGGISVELQEAINHAREVAEGCATGNKECAYQHDRLADWLEELKIIKDILGEDYDLDRLRELVEADRDGRCVVSPCKVGSPVWRVYDDCEFPGDCYTKQKCKGCEYRNVFAEEQAFCLSMLSQNGKLKHPYYTSLEAAEDTLAGER